MSSAVDAVGGTTPSSGVGHRHDRMQMFDDPHESHCVHAGLWWVEVMRVYVWTTFAALPKLSMSCLKGVTICST